MPYQNFARGWWQFNQSLEDEVAAHDFELKTGVFPSYESFTNYNLTEGSTTKHGLMFRSGTTFSADINSLVTDGIYQAGISFWYYSPALVGQVRHITTQELTPKSAPLLAKADTLERTGFEYVEKGGAEWIITEIGVSNTQNAIQVFVSNELKFPTIKYTSDAYDPGLHHVFVTIYSSSSQFYCRVDIDGKFGKELSLSTSDLIIVQNSGMEIWINKCNIGWSAHHTVQEGAFISDLAILSYAATNSDPTIRGIRFGASDILSQNPLTQLYSFFGIGYAQPETVTTTKIFSEGGHIFCARSNGEILEGHKPIWDNEFTFLNQQSLSQLTIVGSSSGTAQWTPQGVRLSGTSIRI